jgi:tetratricopeptide (TPR) repeat protein
MSSLRLLENVMMQQPSRKQLFFGLHLMLACIVSAKYAPAQDAYLSRAKHLFQAGSYDQAAEVLESATKSHPDNFGEHLLLGQIYALKGRRRESIEQFTKAIHLQPSSATAYDTLGTALNHFAEFDQAGLAFKQAVNLDPRLASAHINLAMSLAQGNEFTGAIEQLKDTILLDPKAPSAATSHYLLAKIYETQDSELPDSHRANDELTEAVAIQPRYQQAWLVLGRLRSNENDSAGSIAALTRAVECDPKDSEAQYELGSAYLEQDNAGPAVIHLSLARKTASVVTIALLYKLDRALRLAGNTQQVTQVRAESKALLAQGAAINQHFQEAQTLNHDGLELEAKGEVSAALEKYRAALELNPQQDGFRLNYALAECRLERWQQGIAELKDILERDPSNSEARRALFIAQDKAKQVPIQPTSRNP